MDKWLKSSLALAALLAGAGVLYHFGFAAPRIELPLTQPASAIEECRQAARMVYDVHWAAACATQIGEASQGIADGHPECDLPDDKAAVINAWLDQAEVRCIAEVRAGLDR